MTRGRLHIRELSWVAIEYAGTAILSLAGVKLLTNVLPVASYGRYALGLTFAVAANLLIFGPVGQTVLRFFTEFRQDGTLWVGFRLILKVWIGGCVVVLAFGAVLAAVAPGLGDIAIAGVLLGCAEGTTTIHAAAQSAFRRRRLVAVHALVSQASRFGLAGAAVLLVKPDASAALFGSAVGVAMVGSSHHFYFRRELKSPGGATLPAVDMVELKCEYMRRMRAYASPFLAFGVFGWVQFAGDRWLLTTIAGDEIVGHFAALVQVGVMPILLGGSVMTAFLTPIMFERRAASEGMSHSSLRTSAWLLIMATTTGVLIFHFIGASLMRILTAEAYTEYAYLLPLLVAGSGLFQLGQYFSIYGLQLERSSAYILAKAVVPVSYLILFAVGVITFGLAGGAWAYLVANSCYLVAILAVNRKLASQTRPLPAQVP